MAYLYWIPCFLYQVNSFNTKIKKLKLDETHATKLDSSLKFNWIFS